MRLCWGWEVRAKVGVVAVNPKGGNWRHEGRWVCTGRESEKREGGWAGAAHNVLFNTCSLRLGEGEKAEESRRFVMEDGEGMKLECWGDDSSWTSSHSVCLWGAGARRSLSLRHEWMNSGLPTPQVTSLTQISRSHQLRNRDLVWDLTFFLST